MNRMRPALRLRHSACAVLCALALAACAGDSAAPPAPPPQPQTLSVALGEHGGSVTLTRQGSTYSRDGRAFASGDTVEGNNRQTYRLTLSGNQWTAAYVAPEPSAVALGSSGEALLVTRLEDGTYSAGDETVESGGLVTAASGYQYRLTLHRTLEGNEWRAVYVPPEPASVALGATGGTLSVLRNEDGSFVAGGAPLASGDIRSGSNGSEYRLTLRSGEWKAAYVAPDPEPVNLGASGGRVTVTRNEDGSFNAGSVTFRSGGTVTGANGSEYRLTLRGGMWSVAYVQPPRAEVQLGTSGYSVVLTREENGSYRLNGQPFTSGRTWQAPNGSTYVLTVNRNGEWSSAFVPGAADIVVLGSSNTSIRVVRREDGKYEADGEVLESGARRVAANGSEYQLEFVSATGRWVARYVPSQVEVSLGSSGRTVTLERQENGSYFQGTREVTTGSVYESPTGDRYELSLRGNTWTAQFIPVVVQVPAGESGTVLAIQRLEDGTYFLDGAEIRNGDTVRRGDNEYVLTLRNGRWSARFQSGTVAVDLPDGRTVDLEKREDGSYELNGRVIRSGGSYRINGVLYVLRLTSRGWVATRWTPSSGGSGPISPDPAPTRMSDEIGTSLTGNSVAVDLRAEGANVAGTEGTHLTVGPADNYRQYSLAELLGEGIVRDRETHVEIARREIQAVANSIRVRADYFRIDPDVLQDNDFGLTGLWADAQRAFGRIPGFDGTDLRAPWGSSPSRAGTGHIEAAIDDLEEVVDALSSEGAFVQAYGTRHRATFEKLGASLVFGSQGQTRFGVFANNDGDDQTEPWDYGNFAYSPLDAPSAGTLRTQGRAVYSGDTVAVHAPDATTEPTLYDGDFTLTATFSTGLVTGKITGLEDENGSAYRYGGRNVSTIDLPAATMNSTGAFSITSGGRANLSPGPSLNQVDSEWQGQLVNGDSEALGVWKVDADGGGELLGSFGAGRNGRHSVPTSFEDSSGTSIRTSVFSKGTPITSLARSGSTLNLRTTVTIGTSRTLTTGFASLRLSSGATVTRNIQNGNTDIGDAWLGATSATRFGAWIVPTSSGVTQAYEAFAYSPFSLTPPSVIAALHFTATYTGQTRAVVLESSALSVFSGKAQVDITWDRGMSSNDSLRLRLYDFSRTQGTSDALTAANLHFTKSETIGNTFTGATFDGTNSSHANLSGTPVGNSTLAKGSLVGSTIDGPRAVIGTWTLGVASGESIEGSFGTDIVP